MYSLYDKETAAQSFFLTISGCAIFCLIISLFLKEPKGSFADAHHDEVEPEGTAAAGATS
jgi:hypothetical protein